MLNIAEIIGFHGLKGEVKITFSERLFKNLNIIKQVYAYTSENNYELLDIESFRMHKTNILVKFKQFSSKSEVQHLLNSVLKQEENLLAKLDDNEFYIKDLIGLNVFDKNNKFIGTINTILSDNASSDIIEIRTLSGKISLVPFVEVLVPIVDILNNKVVVNNIPGLIDD